MNLSNRYKIFVQTERVTLSLCYTTISERKAAMMNITNILTECNIKLTDVTLLSLNPFTNHDYGVSE